MKNLAAHSIGIVLVNLGTPDAPTPQAVRRYLAEFLSDPRVISLPRAVWWPILHGLILRTRPRRSAKLYQRIWQDTGSPLAYYSQNLAHRLDALWEGQNNIRVRLAMRYGRPSIHSVLDEYHRAHIKQLIVLPLFPQYCASTTASVFDELTRCLRRLRWLPELRFLTGYADNKQYIEALARQVERHWEAHDRGDQLLISFHGIPQRNFDQGDPYYCYCHKTARLLAERLQLDETRWQLVFQSRFGWQPWLKPYCVDTLKALGAQKKSVDIICPGFAVDCLETLEEIALTNKRIFEEAGGQHYAYIPALNDSDRHATVLARVLEQKMRTTLT